MAEYQHSSAPRGRIYYSRDGPVQPLPDRGYFQHREVRPQVLRVGNPQPSLDDDPFSARQLFKRKSATVASFTNTKQSLKSIRKLILRKSSQETAKKQEPGIQPIVRTSLLGVPSTPSFASSLYSASIGGDSRTHSPEPDLNPHNMAQRSTLIEEVRSTTPTPGQQASILAQLENEKPVASGNGVSVSINLAEPILFLQGFDPADFEERNTTMLRGSLHLRVTKSAKIKTIYLKFRGRAETEWPEGMLSWWFWNSLETDQSKEYLLKEINTAVRKAS